MLRDILKVAATGITIGTAATAQTAPLFPPLPDNIEQDRATQAYCNEINAQMGNDAFHVSRFTRDGATVRPLYGPLKGMTIEFDRNAGTATINGHVMGAEEAKTKDYVSVETTINDMPVKYIATFHGTYTPPLPVVEDMPKKNLTQMIVSGNSTVDVGYGRASIRFVESAVVGDERHFYHCVQHFAPPS